MATPAATRPRRGPLLAAVLLTALPPGLGAPAQADEDDGPAKSPIRLSRDGVAWADGLTEPLFPPSALVPGDRLVESLHVRNESGDPAAAWLQVRSTSTPATQLGRHLLVSARAEGGWGAATPLADLATTTVLLGPRALGPGESVELQVALEFADAPAGTGQDDQVGLDLVVRLAQLPEVSAPFDPPPPSAVAPPTPTPAPGHQPPPPPAVVVVPGLAGGGPHWGQDPDAAAAPDASGGLPQTGAAGGLRERVGVGLGAVATGLLLLAHSRRGRRTAPTAGPE